MLFNIKTGWGVQKQRNEDVVILISSLAALEQHGVRYVFTDRHAYLDAAVFVSDRSLLDVCIDYPLLQRRDFRSDPEDPGKKERYQAEALAFGKVPLNAIIGLACYTPADQPQIQALCDRAGVTFRVVARPDWYF